MNTRMRGYNLVELMISLVVLGLLLGSVLLPLQARYQIENRKEAEQKLEEARQAVIGFGIANRTVARRVEDVYGYNHRLPTGRPYLPCPDITGDGVEDRTEVVDANTMVITLAADDSGIMTREGVCQNQKGLLPWRTLGLQNQVDPWGRKLGYWVDIAFSSEIMGFDESFRADAFDPRLAVITASVQSQLGTEEFYRLRNTVDNLGGLVCLTVGAGVGCPDVAAQHNLLAGVVTKVSLSLGARRVPGYTDFDRARPQLGGILEGVAFVVFSHGKNGWGGINQGNGCLNAPPAVGDDWSERANAFYAPGHPMITDFNCTALLDPTLAENLFISAPENRRTDFDDIVLWAAPNYIIGVLLQSGALPIPKLGFLPEE